jgi:NADH-quinone oxidoreductase subunit H
MSFLNDPVNFISNWLQSLLTGIGAAKDVASFLVNFLGAALLAIGAMVWCIFLIWYERKIAGRFQDRLGPNRVGPFGLIQPIADMMKIFTKEYITPDGADKVAYNLAPILSVASVLLMWAVVPFAVRTYGVDLSVGALYVIAVGAIGELAIIMAGWSSNNKYALMGAFRVVAQLISYEVPMILSLLVPVLLARSMGLNKIVEVQGGASGGVWFLFLAPAAALIFFICSVAEVGRAPFDLIEAESEIVAGFNIEYSGLKFGMFFVGEFLHAFTVALIFSTLFLGGWQGPGADQSPILGFIYFSVKTALVHFLSLTLRFSLPRFRIDQMMDLNWKVLTPLSLVLVGATAIADKLMTGTPSFIRMVVFLVLNVAILAITLEIIRRRGSQVRQAASVAPATVAAPTAVGLPEHDITHA